MIRYTAFNGWRFVALLVALMALLFTIEQRRVRALRPQSAPAALTAANLAAERDTTRDAAERNARVSALIADSLQVVERLVVQRMQRNDALDRALNRERRARYQMSLSVDSLRETVAATRSEPGAAVARADFEVRRPPFTIAAAVEIPPLPDSARMNLPLSLDPISIDARVSCDAPNEQGIRTASIATVAPTWADVRLGPVEQSPDLRASPALMRVQPTREHFARPRLVVGVGRSFSFDGRSAWAWFLGTGIISWN